MSADRLLARPWLLVISGYGEAARAGLPFFWYAIHACEDCGVSGYGEAGAVARAGLCHTCLRGLWWRSALAADIAIELEPYPQYHMVVYRDPRCTCLLAY